MLSVITYFGLFNVEEMEDNKICISSEYVDRVMLPYDRKVQQCKESGARSARKRWGTEKPEKYSDPIAIEKNKKEKNISSEELHSSSVEKTAAAEVALKFSIRHKPDDEVCSQVVGVAQKLPPENQEVRKLKAWGLEAPVLEGRIIQPGVQRSGTPGYENIHKWSAGG
ncbi:hypothetical protein LJC05_01355, partial [Bacteroides sp. OttesenSCG-928-J23]|nr:hypothetical protein [Bacteroides sp. OttesenSCG-928-J23]